MAGNGPEMAEPLVEISVRPDHSDPAARARALSNVVAIATRPGFVAADAQMLRPVVTTPTPARPIHWGQPVRRVKPAGAPWQGSAAEGSGTLTLDTSGAGGELPVSLTARVQDADRSRTNPEELIAGAHSTCYAMAFSNVLSQQGNPPERLDVQARVTLDKVGEGFAITESALTVTGVVPGLDPAAFDPGAGAQRPADGTGPARRPDARRRARRLRQRPRRRVGRGSRS
jgi:osmotically inducible protein OsmC